MNKSQIIFKLYKVLEKMDVHTPRVRLVSPDSDHTH